MELDNYGTEQTNCLLRKDLKSMAQKEGILFGEALEFGVRFLLAERDILEYPNNRLSKNIAKLQEGLKQDDN